MCVAFAVGIGSVRSTPSSNACQRWSLATRDRTTRLGTTLSLFAVALSGQAGARLLKQTGMAVSGDTLLRLAKRAGLASVTAPKILGVDDFAFRRGRTYGTILVNLETHRPVDLLAERSAEALIDWLKHHPGVEVISRDRSTEYARGASEGAPQAQQVADRWHILKNLREAAERALKRIHADLHSATQGVWTSPGPSLPTSAQPNRNRCLQSGAFAAKRTL
jgi:transposase